MAAIRFAPIRRHAVAVAAVTAATCGGVVAGIETISPASPEMSDPARCPALTDSGAYGPEGLIRRVRAVVPKAWRIENQRGRVRLTPKNYRILLLLSLVPNRPEVGSAVRFRRIAARRCVLAVAERSWVVVLDFPKAGTVASSRGIGFFGREQNGNWVMWFRYR
jgi:hypothetical protein